MARLYVGLPALPGDIEKYQERFDMVELRPVDTSLPQPRTLRRFRKNVPPDFLFSIVLPRVVGELAPGPALDDALTKSLEVASVTEARCIVLPTPADVRPTATNRKRLATIFERIPREGVSLCWEPAGIWEHDEVLALSRSLGVIPVLDAGQEDLAPGPIAYTRLRALGKGSAIGTPTIERIAQQLRGRREAIVVVERQPDALRVRDGLRVALAKGKNHQAPPTVVRPMAMRPLIAEDEEQ